MTRGNSKPGAEHGSVLIAVLWLCAVIVWVAVLFASHLKMRGLDAQTDLERLQGLYCAVGGSQEALAVMVHQASHVTGEGQSQDSWVPDGIPHEVTYETGKALVKITEETSRININLLDQAALEELLAQYEMSSGEAVSLSAQMIEFKKKMVADASSQAAAGATQPQSGPFSRLDQILLVPGFPPAIFWGTEKTLDRNEEDGEGQEAIIPLVERFTVYGDRNIESQDANQKDQTPTFKSQGIYRIISTGTVSDGAAVVSHWLIVRLTPGASPGYEVLFQRVL